MGARPAWSTACPDWGKRLRAGRSIIPPPIFASEAERALAIFKELGAETPLVFTNFAQNFHTKLDWVKTLKAEAATQKP